MIKWFIKEKPKTRRNNRIWTTAGGHKLFICEMSDEHLINCIRYLERKAKSDAFADVRLSIVLQFDDPGVDIEWGDYLHPKYNWLVEEAEYRKLTKGWA